MLGVAIVAAGVLFLLVFVGGLFFDMMKYAFHLDFSQDYRQVDEIEQLRFWDRRSGKIYERYLFGLRSIGEQEDIPLKERPALSWLDTSIYDVTESGGLVAWYDWETEKISLAL